MDRYWTNLNASALLNAAEASYTSMEKETETEYKFRN